MNILIFLLGQKFLRFPFSNSAVVTFFPKKKKKKNLHITALEHLLFCSSWENPAFSHMRRRLTLCLVRRDLGRKENEGNKFLNGPPYSIQEKEIEERVLMVRPINKVCFPSYLHYKPNKRKEKISPLPSPLPSLPPFPFPSLPPLFYQTQW